MINWKNYRKINGRYQFYFSLICLVGLAATSWPSWLAIQWMYGFLSIDPDAPLLQQAGGWMVPLGAWLIISINLLLACILISGAIAKLNGWSVQQYLDYFFRYENLPQHWLKKE